MDEAKEVESLEEQIRVIRAPSKQAPPIPEPKVGRAPVPPQSYLFNRFEAIYDQYKDELEFKSDQKNSNSVFSNSNTNLIAITDNIPFSNLSLKFDKGNKISLIKKV